MSGIGNYRNPKIQELLNQLVTEEQYGEYKPIIDEIIQRRAFQYNFSVDRMKNEIENMVRNLKGIELADEIKIEEIGEDTIAAYSSKDKTIYVGAHRFKENKAYFSDCMNENEMRWAIGHDFYHFLTHEIYHAITEHPDNTSGIEQRIEYMENAVDGTGLNEIVTESATTRTVLFMTDKDRNRGGQMLTSGYQMLTCTSSILASVIGTSENELLSHSLNDSKEFYDFIYSNMPKVFEENEKKSLMRSVKFQADMLKSNQIFSRVDLIPSLYTQYYTTLINMAKKCMEKEQEDPTKEDVGAMYYRIAKIGSAITSSIERAGERGIISNEDKIAMLQNSTMLESFQDLKEVVLDTYKICKGNEFEGKTSQDVEQSLLYDMMQDPEYRTKRDRLYFEDAGQRGVWDNSVFQYSYNVIDNEIKKFNQMQNKNKVLNTDEQTLQQVIGAVSNPNLLTNRQKSNDTDDRESR